MPEIKEYAPGTFCWAELVTTDAAAAKKFYCDLFDWKHHDDPIGPDAYYTMLILGEKNVGALYERDKEQAEQGVPPHWGSYVSVADADAVAGKVEGLGGTVVKQPFDVSDIGRMAILQDPTGSVLCVWQPRTQIGAQVRDEPGSLCWNELLTRDTDAAGKFYTHLFGWGSESQQMGQNLYTVFKNQDQPAAGMMAIQPEWGEVPPHWLPYFAVADCDRTADKATSLGGDLMTPPTDIPDVGRFAVVQDPQGAVFGIITLTGTA